MVSLPDLEIPDDGKLAANITYFARALRAAGIPVGAGRLIDAIKAVEAVGFSERQDFYWTLQACFVSRAEQRTVFAQVFRLFWRDPKFLEHMMGLLRPTLRGANAPAKKKDAERRAAEALLDGASQARPQPMQDGEEVDLEAVLSVSTSEQFKTRDFEQMSAAEQAKALRAIARITLPVKPIASRRSTPGPRGHLPDWRATLRASMRQGDFNKIHMRERKTRRPNLVALCDISGSMSGYSRMLLHFLHAASQTKGAGWAKVHGFTFGTRLTNITRHLQNRDIDTALAAAGHQARDWEGGTRIGESLHAFNRDWSRRTLGQGAVVLLITDGLEREDATLLEKEAERLRLSCRRLIWLNPLLRWDGFAPKAAGIRALLPHVDCFCASHSLASIEALADILSNAGNEGQKPALMSVLQPISRRIPPPAGR